MTTDVSTAWSRSLGLRVPIVNAPMGGVAGGLLARAVTAAGGLGMVGMGSTSSPQALRRELALLGHGEQFGIGLIDWVVRQEPAILDIALAAEPVMLSISFGSDLAWVDAVHRRGILAATQVYDVAGARQAADAGIDVVVARGSEGGGHGTPHAPLTDLLKDVLQAVESPVLAAGGIATRSDLDAVVASGAAGAWIGTAFAACHEALTPPRAKQAMVAADSSQTVITRAFDRALGLPWSPDFPARVLRNEFTERWPDDDASPADAIGLRRLFDAIDQDDPTYAPIDAGEGVGAIAGVASAATVVRHITRVVTATHHAPQ